MLPNQLYESNQLKLQNHFRVCISNWNFYECISHDKVKSKNPNLTSVRRNNFNVGKSSLDLTKSSFSSIYIENGLLHVIARTFMFLQPELILTTPIATTLLILLTSNLHINKNFIIMKKWSTFFCISSSFL
jgi:hypothetical protein